MSSPMATLKAALASAVVESQGLSRPSPDELARHIKVPDPEHGDLAIPCFLLAKELEPRQPPPAVAQKIAQSLTSDSRFNQVEAVGPYVNVRVSLPLLAKSVLEAARTPGYGGSQDGVGRTVVIDFSSPNIAKPLAFHHIRSTVIGQAIARIHRARGWTVKGINYLGDWGKQFGLLATGFERHGDPDRQNDAKHLVEVYVKANAEADVGQRKAAIAAPQEASNLVNELSSARAALAEAAKDQTKKLQKRVKGLEKKLRERLKIAPELDPISEFEPNLAILQATADEAQKTLPAAEARDQEARGFLRRMETGDQEALEIWRAFRDSSIIEFQRVYARMGIEFDAIEGESFYSNVLDETLEKVRAQPGTKIDDGAEIVDMTVPKGQPPVILKTRDGTTLYITRDIAAAIDRQTRFSFDRALYVVAADQSLNFSQLFSTLKEMGFAWADRMHHVPFGRVHGMSTRRGKIVFLDEVLEEAVQKARQVCEQSDKIASEHMDEVIEAIGIGSIIFGDLKNLRTSDYTFSYDDVLDFRGHTAPYVQFSHARACSIIRKAGGVPENADPQYLHTDEERAVLKALASYPDAVEQACESFEPSVVTRALLDLAQVTASWLSSGNKDRTKRVLLDNQPEIQAARLALVDAVRKTLAHGLGLIGLKAPPAM